MSGLSRRRLLAGAGAGLTLGGASVSAAIPRASVTAWDVSTDVLVLGSGAAGISAALEARRAGREVLLLESMPRLGGSSTLSGGVVYAGGGTALQRRLGVEDSLDAMTDFIVQGGSGHPDLEKIQLYCEQSPAHFDWLIEQGVSYTDKFTANKGLPMGDESLYYSGNELAWPSRDGAVPAARGHVPGVPGMNGGRHLMAALIRRARELGVVIRTRISGQRLVLAADGRVVGLAAEGDGQTLMIGARRGVVLACGGFIHNREMLKQHAPELYDCSVPWAGAGDVGQGIRMGIAAGANSLRMNQGFAIAPTYPPENVLAGIVVNASGQRFISEESYHGVLGDAIAYHQQGKAWLITDARSAYPFAQDNFLAVARANTIGDLAHSMGFPRGSLQHTVAYYNRHAVNGEDPLFQKSQAYLRPLQGPPYTAWDLSVDKAFFPAHTFGGLQISIDGEVISGLGEAIPGLYAAGRNTAGLPTAPYFASGLSMGDCTFFGRRAGQAAAANAVAA